MNKADRQRFNNVEASLIKITEEIVEDNKKSDKRLVKVKFVAVTFETDSYSCLLYTSTSQLDLSTSRMTT